MLQSEISSNGLGIILHARFKRLRKQSNIRRNKDDAKIHIMKNPSQQVFNVKLHKELKFLFGWFDMCWSILDYGLKN